LRAEFALKAVGPSQILFGTDDPFIDANTSHLDRLSLPDRDREAIMGRQCREPAEMHDLDQMRVRRICKSFSM
jgi:hypothetical protein